MSKSISLKSLTTAAAMAATLAFGAAAHAQVNNSAPPMQKNNDSALPAPPSATGGKTATQRSTDKAMNSSGTSTDKKGTAAGASKLEDTSKPAVKGDGKS